LTITGPSSAKVSGASADKHSITREIKMPDMSEYHETEEEMDERCEAMRDAEKDAFPVEPVHPFTAMLERLAAAGAGFPIGRK
jgi:hypothetical protein